MSYLNKMYGRKSPSQTQSKSEKNPNRVAGGLKAQGADYLTVLGEDGFERELPSKKYVQALEDQVKKQRAALNVLERKQARQDQTIQLLAAQIKRS